MYEYSFDGVLHIKAYIDAMEAMEQGHERDAKLEAAREKAAGKR